MSARGLATMAPTLLALSVAGCSSVSKPDRSFAGPLSAIHVSKGQSFAITFSINTGIGYDWVLRPSPGGGELAFDGARTQEDNPGTVGGGARRTFRFQALRKGSMTLEFVRYFRGKLKQRGPLAVTVG